MFQYFTMGELIRSTTADKKNIDNRCSKEHAENLKKLIENVLDPLRKEYGKPIRVTSGYRCEELNNAVGGSKTSHHRFGMAADIVGTPATKEENKRLFYLAQSIGLKWSELIDEKNFSWIHISYDENNLKNEVLAL